jgi:ribonuclease P protein component
MARPRPTALPRAQRIRKRAEFVRIQSGGVRVATRHFLVLLAAQTAAQAGPPRLGIVASRKVGGAVARNRSKRLVREVFRGSRDLFPPGIDVVVIVRAGTHTLGLGEAQAEIRAVAPLLRRRAAAALAAEARPEAVRGRPSAT